MYVNRLKNSAGRSSEYIVPRDGIPLLFSRECALPDEQIPQIVKDRGVKLYFYPYSYVIDRRSQDGELVLKDVSGHETELPHDLAVFRPDKTVPKIMINGFGLFINAQAQKNLSEKDKADVSRIIEHFKKLRNADPQKSVRHELKHYQNSLVFADAIAENAALNREFFMRTRFIDEISATISEDISEKAHNKEEGLQYVRKQFDSWMSNPERQSYYGPHGDFQHQFGVYQNENAGKDTSKSAEMYQQIFKKFLTFVVEGKEMDLSAAIAPDFKAPHAMSAPLLKKQGISR